MRVPIRNPPDVPATAAEHDADVPGERSRHRRQRSGDVGNVNLKQGSQQMSAHLTVYSMAIAAERPLLLRAADQARHAADAEVALGRGTDRLPRRIGSALRRLWWSGVTADHWAGSGPGGRRAIGQPAG
jgi:hypothetical protein